MATNVKAKKMKPEILETELITKASVELTESVRRDLEQPDPPLIVALASLGLDDEDEDSE